MNVYREMLARGRAPARTTRGLRDHTRTPASGGTHSGLQGRPGVHPGRRPRNARRCSSTRTTGRACSMPAPRRAARRPTYSSRATPELDGCRQRCGASRTCSGRTSMRLGLSRGSYVRRCGRAGTWWDGQPMSAYWRTFRARHPASSDAIPTSSGCDVPPISRASPSAQRDILDALWQLRAVDGKLLYATCSVFHRGKQRQIECVSRTPSRRATPDSSRAAYQRTTARGPDSSGRDA